jgi:hypothetical protein
MLTADRTSYSAVLLNETVTRLGSGHVMVVADLAAP